MKRKLFLFFFLILLSTQLQAQVVTVLNIDTKGLGYDPEQMGNIVRISIDKLQKFQVTDRYDVIYLSKKNNIKIDSCYGKTCLVEIGKAIKSDKMLGGSVERLAKHIIVNLRLIDVNTGTIEKSYIKEYLDFPSEIQTMLEISLREMFGLTNDANTVKKLTQIETYENPINNPYAERLKLNGPRMGVTYFTGALAARLAEPKTQGGFEAYPLMFQFGYQFETQYLNEGNFQGLFEFIPMVTGLDQGLLIPSFTLLNGLRNNKNGWEFAFGPTISLVTVASGYYDGNNNWQLLGQQNPADIAFPIEKRLDSRSKNYEIHPGFLVAVGKSFRSGRLNIPVNFYFLPSKDGARFGASFGFNGQRDKKYRRSSWDY